MVRDLPRKGGREFVARPTDRAIGRNPAGMAGAMRDPYESEFAREGTKEAGGEDRPQGRARLADTLAAMTILRHPPAGKLAGPTSHAAVMAVAVPSAMDRRNPTPSSMLSRLGKADCAGAARL